ncbi:hypothetical protein [Pontibacter arcticus]|uniref:hypothetical protein n=1 Tax=Pontibacter arcticus TaxID=2080288 RepID=UPI00140317C1|nr:hypothetical protein [Pontibacter arcticus]
MQQRTLLFRVALVAVKLLIYIMLCSKIQFRILYLLLQSYTLGKYKAQRSRSAQKQNGSVEHEV